MRIAMSCTRRTRNPRYTYAAPIAARKSPTSAAKPR